MRLLLNYNQPYVPPPFGYPQQNGYPPMGYPPQDGEADIRKSISRDCMKVGAMLIGYQILTSIMVRLFYLAAYFVLSGSPAGYSEAINGLRENYLDVVYSTTFSMLLNSTVTGVSLVITLLFGKIVLGFSFNGYLKPNAKGAKIGVWFFPACFVLNIAFSMIANIFSSYMESVGVTIPEADFTIRDPSVAAVLFQFAYVVIAAPLFEEILYRGMILGAMSKYGELPAALLSALCFGLMHGNIPQAVAAFGTGLAYAMLAISCGSIMPSVVIHILNNLLVSIEELGGPLNIPYIGSISSILQVLTALLGFYVLMTRYSYFRTERKEALSQKGEVTRTILRNPVIIIYFVILIFEIILDIVSTNVGA